MLETTQIKQRLPFIDLIRGITIIEMISYHFLWDLVYLYNADIPWYKSHGAYIWQQSICWTFILLAGFSWHLGKKHMKRGLWAFGGGVVVSLVTAIVLPNDRVRYGVLTLIGSCILIWILLDKVLKKIPAGVAGVSAKEVVVSSCAVLFGIVNASSPEGMSAFASALNGIGLGLSMPSA